jgi:hypothetical protein
VFGEMVEISCIKKKIGARLEVVIGVFGPNRKMKTEVSKMKVGVSILDLERNDVGPPLTSNQNIRYTTSMMKIIL